MDNLVIVECQSGFVAGKLDGKRLLNPRTVQLFQDAKGQTQVAMGPLVGSPAFLTFEKIGFYFTPADKNVIDLYQRVTSPLVLPSGAAAGPAIGLVQ